MIVYRCVPSAHVSAYMSQQVCLDKCEWGDGRARARVCVCCACFCLSAGYGPALCARASLMHYR